MTKRTGRIYGGKNPQQPVWPPKPLPVAHRQTKEQFTCMDAVGPDVRVHENRDRNNPVTEAMRFTQLYGGSPTGRLTQSDPEPQRIAHTARYLDQLNAAQKWNSEMIEELLKQYPGSYRVHDSAVIVLDSLPSMTDADYCDLEARVLALYGIPTNTPDQGKDEE